MSKKGQKFPADKLAVINAFWHGDRSNEGKLPDVVKALVQEAGIREEETAKEILYRKQMGSDKHKKVLRKGVIDDLAQEIIRVLLSKRSSRDWPRLYAKSQENAFAKVLNTAWYSLPRVRGMGRGMGRYKNEVEFPYDPTKNVAAGSEESDLDYENIPPIPVVLDNYPYCKSLWQAVCTEKFKMDSSMQLSTHEANGNSVFRAWNHAVAKNSMERGEFNKALWEELMSIAKLEPAILDGPDLRLSGFLETVANNLLADLPEERQDSCRNIHHVNGSVVEQALRSWIKRAYNFEKWIEMKRRVELSPEDSSHEIHSEIEQVIQRYKPKGNPPYDVARVTAFCERLGVDTQGCFEALALQVRGTVGSIQQPGQNHMSRISGEASSTVRNKAWIVLVYMVVSGVQLENRGYDLIARALLK